MTPIVIHVQIPGCFSEIIVVVLIHLSIMAGYNLADGEFSLSTNSSISIVHKS